MILIKQMKYRNLQFSKQIHQTYKKLLFNLQSNLTTLKQVEIEIRSILAHVSNSESKLFIYYFEFHSSRSF